MVDQSALEGVDNRLGLPINPIVIEDDDTCDVQNTSENHNSDADTVIMGTPESWRCLDKLHRSDSIGKGTVCRSNQGHLK
ncbi:hypothetical protein N7532_010228 [Penicillium argentinense]|uniref:Uncharacterized protein n=1 Tax=Penicillium argentinense TaxID=1131581 RepID=A0A9W9JYB1_9EURO|nr:uncharacterized protein N7532_010228 [Penicillium argentinense]KAJ5085457.1 hypothetical protein N7532_010228 [Penicillium argentinense]